MATTWHAREAVRAHGDEATTREWIERLVTDMADRDSPVEVLSLRRTLARWTEQIVAWHPSHVSNGPTEAANGLIKRSSVLPSVSSFRNFRVRALLYAAEPKWLLLQIIASR